MVRRVVWFVKQNEYAAPDAMSLENFYKDDSDAAMRKILM